MGFTVEDRHLVKC